MHAIGKKRGNLGVLLLLTLSAAASACSGAPDTGAESGNDDNALAAQDASDAASSSKPSTTPTPVAALTLKNGNTVEFYDFGAAGLVMESGAAYTKPVVTGNQRISPEELVPTWNKIADGAPVPAALQQLQERLMHQSGTPNSEASKELAPSKGAVRLSESPEAQSPQISARSLDGCTNGCCDYDWLSTFSQCQNPEDYSWFLFNYGTTWENSGDDVQAYVGMVCSASGTSTFHVAIGSAGGNWTVPEATWRSFSWSAYCPWWGCYDDPARTSVNSTTDMHLHTYCGGWYQP
jgi:hypothetical protein